MDNPSDAEVETDGWLLIKRGLYWRLNSMGYTGLKTEAERYSLLDARSRINENVSMIHESDAPDYAPECCDRMARKDLESRIAAMNSMQSDKLELAREAWQPIETAPKDGTKFIAAKFVGHPDHDSCFWWASSCSWSERWQKWWDGVEPCGLAGPTHWMAVVNPSLSTLEETP